MTESLTIVGWLWRDPRCSAQYLPEHANIWARMIHRNLSMPHRFVLMTDQPEAAFDPLIEAVPLWDDARELRKDKGWAEGRPHCFTRLKAFAREAEAIFGRRFVSVDLDCVVMDALDPLFDRAEDFVIYRRPAESGRGKSFNPYNGSMWMMTAGARAQVWDDFHGAESVATSLKYLGTDQAWLRHVLGPDEPGWGVADGVLGWPAVYGDNRWLYEPPPQTRIIFFQGDMKPWHVVRGKNPAISHLWVEGFYQ